MLIHPPKSVTGDKPGRVAVQIDDHVYLGIVDELRAQHPDMGREFLADLARHVVCTHPSIPQKDSIWREFWRKLFPLALVLISISPIHAQPSNPLTVRGQNGGVTQFTRAGGLLNFDCDGTTVICSWSSATNTWTITSSGGGGGGTPGGSNCEVQYNNSGSFGGASDFCFDVATGFFGINNTAPYGAFVIDPGAAKPPGFSVYEDGADLTNGGTVLGFPTLLDIHQVDGNTYYQVGYTSDAAGQIANFQDAFNNLSFQFSTGTGGEADTLLQYGGVAGGNPFNDTKVQVIYQLDANTGAVGWWGFDGTASHNTPVLTWDASTDRVAIVNGGGASTAACYLANGKTLGHCTSVVGVGGGCTCA